MGRKFEFGEKRSCSPAQPAADSALQVGSAQALVKVTLLLALCSLLTLLMWAAGDLGCG